MPIDWFTVAAQAINFLILVWLLKRFLFKPILHAIDEREKGIATQLAEAETKKTEAQNDRDDFQHKNATFDQERAALLQKATDAAKNERQRLLDEVRQEADSMRDKRHEALRSEQQNLSREIIRWTQQEVFAITRKTLADLATVSLEERMAAVFIHRLRTLTGPAKDQLASALKTSALPACVRSAFDLPPEQHTAIQTAVNETFAADIPIRFETVPELVSGIELSANGQKIAWSVADYLATLEKSASELLPKDAGPESKPDAKANSDAKPGSQHEAKVATVLAPRRESNGRTETVASAPKADH